MNFPKFKKAVQQQYNTMLKHGPIFKADIDRDGIWTTYLASFPEGTNPTYRERTEHDCSCCRSFIKNAGSMVQIRDGNLVSIWDVKLDDEYQVVADALSQYVKKTGKIDNVFLHSESAIGVDKNREFVLDRKADVVVWEHFHIVLSPQLHTSKQNIGPALNDNQTRFALLHRALEEITVDAIETVQDLIQQNSLYRGAEKKAVVAEFANLKKEYDLLTGKVKEWYTWQKAAENNFACRIRNDVIGTLLVDLSEGVDLEKAVKSFEDKVSGTNYKRPTALVTPKMRDLARKAIEEAGLMSALERRYAKLEDISINNLLFANRDLKKKLSSTVFDNIPVTKTPKTLSKVEEMTMEQFITGVLPNVDSIELLVENKHAANLVSLIAPYDFTAKPLFKWKNPFSWSYNGDVADSDIRQRVQAQGGRVDGVFRFSHSWNHIKRNASLMDLHVFMPGSTKGTINGVNETYGNSERVGWNHRNHTKSGGVQDVDYTAPAPVGYIPVENITFPSLAKMPDGQYRCAIHNWSFRNPTTGGFQAEIEFGGQVYQYEFDRPLTHHQWIHVATVTLKNKQFSIEHHIPTTTQIGKEVWGLTTNDFHPVTAVMLSPNCWDGEEIGNKHYFFMLKDCKNDGTARGFYNEFLHSSLEPYRKTMELVGSKTRTDQSTEQMSGLGFSSTQRNSVTLKVTGSFTRTIKVNF